MADLRTSFAGIRSPNPFWLASGPPTNTADQVLRAFDAGWGGAVWKTLGKGIVNVSSRLASLDHAGQRLAGLGNIELISDRTVAENLRDIQEVKRLYPDRPVIASLMFGPRDEWQDVVLLCEEAGCDGLELNFGCPHGMCERGMGSAVGQEPRIVETLTGWVMEVARIPVLVKLTPNVTDIREPARAAVRAGADALALINTVQCIPGVDLERFVPLPRVAGASSHGGLSGPAVKPIALRMILEMAQHVSIPLIGVGGISCAEDAIEYFMAGASFVGVVTAGHLEGTRAFGEIVKGIDRWVRTHGYRDVGDFVGLTLRRIERRRERGLVAITKPQTPIVDPELCIGCGDCGIVCVYDAIHVGDEGIASANPDKCYGCGVCRDVCPVQAIRFAYYD